MKLLLVDDHPIVIAGCRRLFAGDPGVTILGAGTIGEARTILAEQGIDVVVLDINLPDGSGLDFLREILAGDPKARIVVFSISDTPLLIAHALESGAKSYVSKNSNPPDLVTAVRTAARGESWLPDELIQQVALVRASKSGVPLLTQRESDIIRLLARGLGLAEIAAAVSVSYKTITTDCAELRSKLGAQSLSELVRIAAEFKLY